MVNYKYGKIYKLVNDEDEILYIGSTCDSLTGRFSKHKSLAKNDTERPIYKYCNGKGWDNIIIQIIQIYPCGSKKELLICERHHYDIFKPKFNCYKPIATNKERGEYIKKYSREYRTKNRDKLIKASKIYNEKNKEKLAIKSKIYRKKNKEIIKVKDKIRKQKNKVRDAIQRKKYYEENKERILQRNKKYEEKNKEKLKEYRRQYRIKNREKINEKYRLKKLAEKNKLLKI